MKSLCVFCGSSAGRESGFIAAARDLGRLMAERDITLVFGGGSIGIMGALADAVLAAKGRAIGVIPQMLWDKEVGHRGLTSMLVVETMHDRKARMAELSDAFAVLPGGLGTLEEFFEIWTWAQLGIHAKPFGVLNVDGFYDPLLNAVDSMAAHGFIRPEHRRMVQVANQPQALLDKLDTYVPAPAIVKWAGTLKA
ncbi:MAG: TIGR00730 family Rossman fold protein [Rhodospirillaceae bacterium]|nr:TIGR00730 family Rossman fold protein [Rhodospirillaceae bacterium]